MNMNKLGKMKSPLVVAVLILTITVLTACASAGATVGTTAGVIVDATTVGAAPALTACHATGDPANPYVEITITNDISPVPANGCPASPVSISDGKIRICHATGSQTNPYNEITVSVNGLNGHGKHGGDIVPAPEGGCPANPKDDKPKDDKSKNDKKP